MKFFSFSKKKHLCGKNNITQLFEAGSAFVLYPFRVVYCVQNAQGTNNEQVKILISVPKKKHRRANVRNHIKRLIRESYRLNQHEFVNFAKNNNLTISLGFQYISEDVFKFNFIEKKIQEILLSMISHNSEKILLSNRREHGQFPDSMQGQNTFCKKNNSK
ncbi:MAG: ribonuclease P protein component [Prevotellaceae bacterium]|jgi:ribonuclease P protein component|nr:ribonuclease P protein component [Prevotellaceae bacterium]